MNTTTNTRGVSEAMPEAFAEYVAKNYSGEVVFSNPRWHAERLWRAARYAALSAPEPAAQGEAVADECRHDWVDYVQEEYKPRHRVLELGESNIERYVRIGLMCTICGKEKVAPSEASVWRCTRSSPTGDGGTYHACEYAKTDADMMILRDQGYACELLTAPPAQPAERTGLIGAMHDMRDAVGGCCDQLQERIKELEAQPAERVPEATTEMVEAAAKFAHDHELPAKQFYRGLWRAMCAASPSRSDGGKGVDGASLIATERKRQKSVEGWTHAHDLQYERDELVRAAICYASRHAKDVHCPPTVWPWDQAWWKPRNRRDDLVRAGALIAAELDRLEVITSPARGYGGEE